MGLEAKHPEIGRELRVSELTPPQIVWIHKMGGKFGSTYATMWVQAVDEMFVLFYSGELQHSFVATRIGADLERITDDSNGTMKLFEYLGKP